MARKKKDDVEEGAYWMDTYGDMVTLLLTFFVLLFSMSSIKQEKWQMLVTALKGQFKTTEQLVVANPGANGDEKGNGKVPPSGKDSTMGTEDKKVDKVESFDDLYLYLKQYVESKGLEGDVQLSKGDGFTYIQFKNNIFFDGDSSVLRSDGKVILDVLSGALAGIPKEIKEISVYGHTAQERVDQPNTVNFDWSLSNDRAKNVVLYLIDKNILSNDKYASSGFGQNRPIVPHDGTEATRRKNRRVEIRITQSGKAITAIEEIYNQLNNPSSTEKKAD
ncbi:flagellar motor protein MotB [Paludicola sp. MB14-C6]|uniref:OmpA/MotB family protein n=1 Tax=Paludihabitans sp. MB14-C6 TaxID=3070656 RepID=UPI0027DC982B|nr:flagellar motor protein MotB [Paludicola sp. MB14-C6]WMJ24240.1 flagellar motor protein MotB [Paludicola sp. MB14-C6]